LFEEMKRFFDALKERAFALGGLLLRETAEVQARIAYAFDARTKTLERVEANRELNDLRVRDCVRRARQQVSEADLPPNRSRQNAQR
jgi:hypothetical protein